MILDFNKLPSHILLKILRRIPIEQQASIERIVPFQEFSHMVISETKSINLTTGPFSIFGLGGGLDANSFWTLLSLCSENLKEIEIGSKEHWLEAFAQFSCPNLESVIAESINTPFDFFSRVLINNRNLRILKWLNCANQYNVFPKQVMCEKLEVLEIYRATDGTFESMTGKCPNLKEFKISNIREIKSQKIFDNFFATCLNLESFCVIIIKAMEFRFAHLTNFWNLHSLKSLQLGFQGDCNIFNDRDLQRISTLFPRLKNLTLEPVNLTNDGLEALATLTNLTMINFNFTKGFKENLDLGMQRLLIGCKHLQKVQMLERAVDITATTLIAFFEHCPDLHYFEIGKIIDAITINQAVVVVESLGKIVQQDCTILIGFGDSTNIIWRSDKVKAALEGIEEASGHVIKINP